MNNMNSYTLSLDEIKNLSSSYITEDLKSERWTLLSMEISPNLVSALASVSKPISISSTSLDYHLSFFTASEIVGQILVIFMHYHAGFKVKTREVWVTQANYKFIRPVKHLKSVSIILKAKKLIQNKNRWICDFESEVTDSSGGLFTGEGRVWLV
jgi:hypothetical protein